MHCPFCEYSGLAPTFRQLAHPRVREAEYARLYRCPCCRMIFAPRGGRLTVMAGCATIGASE